ncbi:MAG TPA: hypothetical protein VI756_17610 [Blastocatellia bacterium]
MIVTTPKRLGEIARKLFEVLASRADAMPVDTVLSIVEAELPLGPWERTRDIYHGMKPFEEMAHLGAISLTKAGWMFEHGGLWEATDKGRAAYTHFTDPELFIRRSARQSLKGWLIVHMPRSFGFLSRIKTQFDIERQMIHRLGLWTLLPRAIGWVPAWQRHLPIQSPRRFEVDVDLTNYDELVHYLDSSGVEYRCAGHTLYLPPEAASRSIFAGIMGQYPADAGLKITKNTGGARGPYVFGGVRNRKISVMYNRITYDRARLVLVANLLFSKQLSSRLYDLVEIRCGRQLWTAYVVRHLTGRVPTESECKAGIDRIRDLENQGLLKVTLSQGYEDEDFSCPTCNNNAFMDDGKFCYVDFQSFMLMNYDKYLKAVAADADLAAATNVQMRIGGKASEAVVRAPAVWAEQPGFSGIAEGLNRAGIAVRDHVVMDLGCQAGLNMAGYLKLGASWCHGWDTKDVIAHAEQVLLATGCTRFSLSESKPGLRLDRQIPGFLIPMLKDCIIVSSSATPLDKLLDALSNIPWAFIVQTDYPTNGRSSESIGATLEELGLMLKVESCIGPGDQRDPVVRIFERTAQFCSPLESRAILEPTLARVS